MWCTATQILCSSNFPGAARQKRSVSAMCAPTVLSLSGALALAHRGLGVALSQEIVDAVTNANPAPVKLKLEKVRRAYAAHVRRRNAALMHSWMTCGNGRCTFRVSCRPRSDTLGSCTRALVRCVVGGGRLHVPARFADTLPCPPVQEVPSLDCKGIETVRRDQCPATAKLMDKTLRVLFQTKVQQSSEVLPRAAACCSFSSVVCS